MTRWLLASIGGLLLLCATWAQADVLEPAYVDMLERWVDIDTQARRARVMQGNVAIAEFERIAIGSRGAAAQRVAGDRTTPLGEFRIDRINRHSRFHLFLRLNYPTLRHLDGALRAGVIDRVRYWDIYDRMVVSGGPPQDTVLGGHIGIHGIGEGNPEIHRRFDWTQGCIALTNEEIEQLANLVGIGAKVVIR